MNHEKNHPHSRRSPEERARLIEKYTQSNQSKKSFCAAQGINYQTFIGWTKPDAKIRKALTQKATAEKFIPLESSSFSALPFAEIFMEGGRKLSLYHPVSCEFLKRLL